ncbi:MAG: RNase adapter RapZ [Armatimonadetes bacterium]|nr:RNase adapter RapZ [Armatimonadota bacterium]MCX7968623.1 RNase adapter RapZ [Armatimonadota bacterium]MDW8142292.1 RNase adapter RapZ [Armatimonadota bacterium]
MSKPELLVITGMSGAGKTLALHVLEDAGYFCVDNLPPRLLPTLVDLCAQSRQPIVKVALVADVRGGEFFRDLTDSINRLRNEGYNVRVFFLEANDEVLVQRYKETRRRHPLSDNSRDLLQSIQAEREQLAEIRALANEVIDTSGLTPQQFRDEILRRLQMGDGTVMQVKVVSFGFKYGVPVDADLVFDVRFLHNPNYEPELRHLNGRDERVKEFVLKHGETQEFLSHLKPLLKFTLPLYRREGKSYLTIAVGCTGGRHRSVTLAEAIAEIVREQGYNCTVLHRDINR